MRGVEEEVKCSDFIFRTFIDCFGRCLLRKFPGQRYGFCPTDAGSGTGAAVDECLGPPALRTPPFSREQGRQFGLKRPLLLSSAREPTLAQKFGQTPPKPAQERSMVQGFLPAQAPAIGRGFRGFGDQLRSLPG